MPLQILSEPSDPAKIAAALRRAVEEAIAGAQVDVTPTGPGHFEIRVASKSFTGRSRMQQQQTVYAAIAPLMRGDPAPVHAIDRLETRIA